MLLIQISTRKVDWYTLGEKVNEEEDEKDYKEYYFSHQDRN